MPILSTDTDLRQLLRDAHTIAIVGLSDNPSRDSYRIALYLQQAGYDIVPVNPSATEVLGVDAVPDLSRIDRHVDIVNIFRRPEHVPAVVEAAIAAGASAVWMQFDTGHEAAAERAAAAGLDVVVDRCIMIEHRRLIR